jgi:hypothetical protein
LQHKRNFLVIKGRPSRRDGMNYVGVFCFTGLTFNRGLLGRGIMVSDNQTRNESDFFLSSYLFSGSVSLDIPLKSSSRPSQITVNGNNPSEHAE